MSLRHRQPLLLLLFLAACGGPPEEDLIGTWVADKEAKRTMFGSASNDVSIEFTFTAKEVRIVISARGKKDEQRWRYQITKKEGRRLWLEQAEAQLPNKMEVEVEGDELTVFKRKKSARFTRK